MYDLPKISDFLPSLSVSAGCHQPLSETRERMPLTPLTPLTAEQSYAFVMSPRLGDSLLSMIVVHNLVRNGFRVKVFGAHIDALRDWFPGIDIAPALSADAAPAALRAFDIVLHAYHADKVLRSDDLHPNVVVMDDWPVYRQVKNMVEIQMDLCRTQFNLPDVVPENGLVVPAHLRSRAAMRRIVIHPIASDVQKSWRPMRFVKLAKQLRSRGFEPEFLLPPAALKDWKWLETHGFRPKALNNLSDVAAYVIQSGWVIGNDSGIGHLASNVGVPTVSLAMRPSIARRWKPGWAPSRAVIAPAVVPGRFLKEKSWKYLLSTARVSAAFDQLRHDCGVPRLAQARGDFDPQSQNDAVADVRHAS